MASIFHKSKLRSRTAIIALSAVGLTSTAAITFKNPLVNTANRIASGCALQSIEECIPEKILPSVVSISTSFGEGSGVIVDKDHIVTNAHVVAGVDELKIHLSDDRVLDGRVLGYHQGETDLALVQILNPPDNLKSVKLVNDDNLKVGRSVFAIGNPLGLQHTVSQGTVSQLNALNGYIQLDMTLNPGNSGGAVVDANGRLVGLSTAILAPDGNNSGIGFATPVKEVTAFLEAYGQGEIPAPPSRAPQMIELSSTVIEDQLSFERSTPLEDGSLSNFYQFVGQAGQKVEIIMSAVDGVDPYLLLELPNGEVFENDDSAGGLNARLFGELPVTGVYTLYANTAAAGQQGDYSLVVAQG